MKQQSFYDNVLNEFDLMKKNFCSAELQRDGKQF